MKQLPFDFSTRCVYSPKFLCSFLSAGKCVEIVVDNVIDLVNRNEAEKCCNIPLMFMTSAPTGPLTNAKFENAVLM